MPFTLSRTGGPWGRNTRPRSRSGTRPRFQPTSLDDAAEARYRQAMVRLVLVLLLAATAGCKDCVGARTDAELLPELTAALETIEQPDAWEEALRRFERDARIYRRPQLANRIARLASQAEAARQPESLCSPTQIGTWIKAHLSRLRAEFEGQPTTPVEPVLCGTAPRPLIRGVDEVWNLYGLDLNAKSADLKLTVTGTAGMSDKTPHLAVVSSVKAEVQLAGEGGLRLHPLDQVLTLKAGDRVLSELPITDERPALRVTSTVHRGGVAAHPTATATVPADHVLIGGGCRASFRGDGQLLIASYPSGVQTWTCGSKDHLASDPSHITAYALSIPKSMGISTYVATSTSGRGGHMQALANLPAGYKLIGGGCRITKAIDISGHLLTIMRPGPRSYECEAKDHVVESVAVLNAYAIGIPEDIPFDVLRDDVAGVDARRGHVSARLSQPRSILVGGGCMVTQGEHGNLLWASYPRVDERRWVCAHKDHQRHQTAMPTAFALGLRAN